MNMDGDLKIELQDEQVVLLPERALYWPRRQTLVVADPHLGKAAAFRAAAIPVPGGTTAANLERLAAAITRTGARRLICLGDLLHARSGRVPETVAAGSAWRERHPHLEFWLVRGNHDRHAGDPPAEWRVECFDEPVVEPPFAWRHFPEAEAAGYTIAGHLHPAIRLGRGQLSETLPCFFFGETVGLLPAFGDFTGTMVIRPQSGDRVFVLVENEVMQVPVKGGRV